MGFLYTITVDSTITNGTVSADKENAAEGDEITLTIEPATEYELDTLTVDGTNVTADVTDGEYTFEMPAKNVTVTATFKAVVTYVATVTTTDGTTTTYTDFAAAVEAAQDGDTITLFDDVNPVGITFNKTITIVKNGFMVGPRGYAEEYTEIVTSDTIRIVKAITVTLNNEDNWQYVRLEYPIDSEAKNWNGSLPVTQEGALFTFKIPEDITKIKFCNSSFGATPEDVAENELRYVDVANPEANGVYSNKTYSVVGTEEEKYKIYVDGVQVTAGNAANVLGDGTVSYNAETNTLTLNNANLTSGTTYNNNLAIATILAKDDLNIELKGTNRITAPDMTGFSNGISVDGDLTIFGSGSLTTIGGNITGVAETGEIGRFESSGIYASDLLTIRTAEVNAVGGTVSVTGDTIVESSNRICQVYSHGIVGGYGMVLEDGAKLNANGGSVSANTANIDFAFSKGVFVFYGDTIIYDAVLTATGGKVIGGENACSFGISTNYADVKVCDADAKVTLTADDVEATVLTGSNGISVHGGLDIQAGSVSVTSGKRTEGTNGDNDAVYVEGYTDEDGVTHGGNISLADGMKISVPKNGTVKKIDDTYYTIVDGSGNIATNVKIEARKKSYSGSGGGSSSNTTTATTKNDDGSTTKTTTNKLTGTVTEVTTGTDGSTTTVETKKDGTVTTTEKDKDGNTTTTVENPDGSSATTEKNKDGSETVVEKDTDGTTTTTEKDSEGNKTVTTEKADGTVITEETKKDGTTVKTETTASGETIAEVKAKGETEVVIPVENADEVTKVIVTDKDGNETEAPFEVKDGGIAISVSGNSAVSVQTGHTCYAKDYTDVDTDSWYHLNIDYVLENGLMKGTAADRFAPNGIITRAMMVTVLYRAEGEPTVTGTAAFEDVDTNAYYAKAVVWGQQNGIIKGYSETEFAPDQNITREQIAAIMHRYAQYKGYDVSAGKNTNILSYDDFDSISEYAVISMQYAVGSGILRGKTASTLNPKDNAARAEIAAILNRFIEANK